jgi:periplasmic copper chaperone A
MSPRSFTTRIAPAVATTGLLVLATAAPALGHATIPDGGAIPSGASTEIHLRVSHGCGELPTDTVEVQLPDGIVAAQPAYVPGWGIEVEMVGSEPYERFGETLTERVGVIRWIGGDLPNETYFDFGVRATFLQEAGAEIPIPIVQRCGDEELAWIEIPAEGQDADELEHPAPTISIVEADAG